MIKLKVLCAAIAVCFVAACNSNHNEAVKTPAEQEITDTVFSNSSADTMKTIVNHSMIWTVQLQDSAKQKLLAPDSSQIKSLSSAQLINLLNENNPGIHIDFIKVSHDTMYVKIPEDDQLANQIGDTGAQNYLASVTYTLTEVKGIHFVHIAMKTGDHVEPGVYSRDDFKDLR